MCIFSDLSNSDIISLSSSVVALSALSVAIWQGMLSRRHNVLSLQPFVGFGFDASLDKNIGLNLGNSGVGPAFVKSVGYIINNTKYEFKNGDDFLKFRDRAGFTDFSFNLKCNFTVSSTVILPTEKVVIFEIYYPDRTNTDLVTLNRSIITRLPTFFVNYECSYKKKYYKEWEWSFDSVEKLV